VVDHHKLWSRDVPRAVTSGVFDSLRARRWRIAPRCPGCDESRRAPRTQWRLISLPARTRWCSRPREPGSDGVFRPGNASRSRPVLPRHSNADPRMVEVSRYPGGAVAVGWIDVVERARCALWWGWTRSPGSRITHARARRGDIPMRRQRGGAYPCSKCGGHDDMAIARRHSHVGAPTRCAHAADLIDYDKAAMLGKPLST